MTGLLALAIIMLVLSAIFVAGMMAFLESRMVGGVTAVICLLICGFVTWWHWTTTYRNDHWTTCTITSKHEGSVSGVSRIYTSDCGQLVNEDSILRLKFNSSRLWEEVPDEGMVQVRIAGTKSRIFAHYPNVFDIRPVQTKS